MKECITLSKTYAIKAFRPMKPLAALLSLALLALAEENPLQATVQKVWTVDSAREEAFRDAQQWVDVSQYPQVDPNLIENRMAIGKGLTQINQRSITVFSVGDYSIAQYCSNISHYYDITGKLFSVEFSTSPALSGPKCPVTEPATKAYKHDYPNGTLSQVVLTINEKRHEDYLFNLDGSLSVAQDVITQMVLIVGVDLLI